QARENGSDREQSSHAVEDPLNNSPPALQLRDTRDQEDGDGDRERQPGGDRRRERLARHGQEPAEQRDGRVAQIPHAHCVHFLWCLTWSGQTEGDRRGREPTVQGGSGSTSSFPFQEGRPPSRFGPPAPALPSCPTP